MAREELANRNRCRLVEEDAHLGSVGRCLIQAACGKLDHGLDWLAVKTVEPSHDVVNVGSCFEVLKDGRYGHPRALENPRTTHFCRGHFRLRDIVTSQGSPSSGPPSYFLKVSQIVCLNGVALPILTFLSTLCRLSTMAGNEPRITTQTLSVIGALIADTEGGISGAEIARQTNLASGSLYPILQRLEDAGWAESRWETEDPHALGRPRRRLYQVTGIGAQKARAALRRVVRPFRGLAWR